MSGLAVMLVLLSAVAHATWNLLVKRGVNPEVFVWWSNVAIVVLLLPLAVVLGLRYEIQYPGWWFVLGTSILHVLYFLFLGRGYSHGDLSLVYPLARGTGPALVPILGVLVLEESVSFLAVLGIVAVFCGIYTVYWWGRFRSILNDPLALFRDPGSRFALVTGLVIAAYSVWDKVGVSYVTPFLYMYLMSLGTATGLAPYVLRTHGQAAIRREWASNAGAIVVVALLTFLAYGLVLTAFQFSRVSYISPSREIGIVVGVVLGAVVLKERLGRGRLVGSGMIAAGLVLIAVAP